MSRGSIFVTEITPYPPLPSSTTHNISQTPVAQGQCLYQSQSQTETTISRYCDPNGINPQNLPVMTGGDGKSYSCNVKDLEYTSKFEVRFNDCFKCDGRDYHNRSGRPLANSSNQEILKTFFRKLNSHRPAYQNRMSIRHRDDKIIMLDKLLAR